MIQLLNSSVCWCTSTVCPPQRPDQDVEDSFQALLLCRGVVASRGLAILGDGLLAGIIAMLVRLDRAEDAEVVLESAITSSVVQMRSFMPLLESYAARGHHEKAWRLYQKVQQLSDAGEVKMTGEAVAELLTGLDGQADKQDAVLEHFAARERMVDRKILVKLQSRLHHAKADLVAGADILTSGQLSRFFLAGADAERVLSAIRARLRAETTNKLEEMLVSQSGFTCVVDGANVGYRGAVSRGLAQGFRATKQHSKKPDGNPHAAYFRHDQIAIVVEALEAKGEVPLVFLPQRYTVVQAAAEDAAAGGGDETSDVVATLESRGQLFVVADEEPDDLLWIYATVHSVATGMRRPLFAVTRDEGSDHKEPVWGLPGPREERADRLRAWERWKAQQVRWYTLVWNDEDHFSTEVTAIIEDAPRFSHELQRAPRADGKTWLLPDELGYNWLRVTL
eukprot:TRINITY_DN17430_c0_g1_i10.p1 TRINITY_DN17430_c0_g1~~TRINITY_DN17430_c0_g1_i10.p1  ORF type:complete len:451 (-),score=95.27 TRINITY_DN17430_c0_g1_i10:106-1458(-)